MIFSTRLKDILAAAAMLAVTSLAPAAQPDGPYVLRGASGWEAVWVRAEDEGRRAVQPLADDASLAIAAVGGVPAFDVRLRAPASNAPDSVRTAPDAPLFVVADTHGEYEILVAMLRAHGVLDARLRWSFARGHLVVLGDVFDRGPNHLEILWLLYQLEAEAGRAGGGVHLVLGNHEAMVLRGDLRYLNARYVDTARVLGVRYDSLFAADSLLGQWLRSRPAMLKVNDLLCMHAGVSRALLDSGLTLADVNASLRSVLAGEPGQGAIAELVTGSLGPLWYRGYFEGHDDQPRATAADVDRTLETFGARRVLVGHTIVPTITPLYAGKVVAVQVYPKREAGVTRFEGLLIRKGQLLQATPDGGLHRLGAGR